jgi:hypothetical protein
VFNAKPGRKEEKPIEAPYVKGFSDEAAAKRNKVKKIEPNVQNLKH